MNCSGQRLIERRVAVGLRERVQDAIRIAVRCQLRQRRDRLVAAAECVAERASVVRFEADELQFGRRVQAALRIDERSRPVVVPQVLTAADVVENERGRLPAMAARGASPRTRSQPQVTLLVVAVLRGEPVDAIRRPRVKLRQRVTGDAESGSRRARTCADARERAPRRTTLPAPGDSASNEPMRLPGISSMTAAARPSMAPVRSTRGAANTPCSCTAALMARRSSIALGSTPNSRPTRSRTPHRRYPTPTHARRRARRRCARPTRRSRSRSNRDQSTAGRG